MSHKDEKKEEKKVENNCENKVEEAVIDFKEELEKAKKDQAELLNKYLRSCADFENARKRWDKDREDLIKFSNYSLLRELLVVLDEMEQGLRMVREHKNTDDIVKGLDMTYNKFLGIMGKNGLTAIEAKGKKFDPHIHEIAGSLPGDGPEHMVLEEIQKGYLFEGKVLRTSKVVVSVKLPMTDDRSQKTDNTEQEIDKKNEIELDEGNA